MRLSHEKARVTTKTRGVISPLGEIIAHDVSFDPIVTWAHFFWDCLLVGLDMKWMCSKVGEFQNVAHLYGLAQCEWLRLFQLSRDFANLFLEVFDIQNFPHKHGNLFEAASQ